MKNALICWAISLLMLGYFIIDVDITNTNTAIVYSFMFQSNLASPAVTITGISIRVVPTLWMISTTVKSSRILW